MKLVDVGRFVLLVDAFADLVIEFGIAGTGGGYYEAAGQLGVHFSIELNAVQTNGLVECDFDGYWRTNECVDYEPVARFTF